MECCSDYVASDLLRWRWISKIAHAPLADLRPLILHPPRLLLRCLLDKAPPPLPWPYSVQRPQPLPCSQPSSSGSLRSFLPCLSTALFLPRPLLLFLHASPLVSSLFSSILLPFYPSLHPIETPCLRATDTATSVPPSRPGWRGATALRQ